MKRPEDKRSSKGAESADRRSEPAAAGRFFRVCLVVDAVLIGGLCGVAYWAYREISLEHSYQQQYGPDWQDEFQRYHGLIHHAHRQIEVCALGLLALTAIVTWLCVRNFRRRSLERFTYHSV